MKFSIVLLFSFSWIFLNSQESFFISFPEFANQQFSSVVESENSDFYANSFLAISSNSSVIFENNIILKLNNSGDILSTFSLSDLGTLSSVHNLKIRNDTLSGVGYVMNNTGDSVSGFYHLLLNLDLELLKFSHVGINVSDYIDEYILVFDMEYFNETYYFLANGYSSFVNYIITMNDGNINFREIVDFPNINDILPVSSSEIHILGNKYQILDQNLETINELNVESLFGLNAQGHINLLDNYTILGGKTDDTDLAWEPILVSLDSNLELVNTAKFSYDDDHFSNWPPHISNLTNDVDNHLVVGSTLNLDIINAFNGNNPTSLIFAKYDKYLNQLCTERLDLDKHTFLTGTKASEFNSSFLGFGTQSKIGIDSHYPFLLRGNNMCELSSIQKKEIFIPEIVLYPNTTADRLYIDVADYEIGGVSIADVNGKEVINDYQNRSGNLDVSLLDSGTYFITVALKDGKTFTKSFVKM